MKILERFKIARAGSGSRYRRRVRPLFIGAFFAAVFVLCYSVLPNFLARSYGISGVTTKTAATAESVAAGNAAPLFVPTHLPTPVPLKAIYMTQCTAGALSLREGLAKTIETTELNAVVIDIKDYSGRISFVPSDPELKESVSPNCFASDMPAFIDGLHKRGIYVIGRITVFQDPYLSKKHPEWAVKRLSNKESLWTDRKGISYLDPGSEAVWNYFTRLAKESYGAGFDELNFDYIRFPSDGNMSDIYFPSSAATIKANPTDGKARIIKRFFSYLSRVLKPTGAVLSADLFGMTTTNTDDLNIGQVLENTLPYFDYVSPMVYPSHYPPTFMGFKNPASHPYEVIKYSMDRAVTRAEAASTTPNKIRPWLQDFNLGAMYTAAMVQSEMKAVYDSGLRSWMLWNAANRYTVSALEKKGTASVAQ